MKLPTLLAALLLVTPAVFQGQQSSPVEMAKKVDSHYNALHSLSVAFTEKYEGLGMARNESGTLLLKKPGRMRWTYSHPQGKLFVLDGKYAYFYTPGAREAKRIPASKLDDLRSPLRFLLGHTQLAKELTNLTLSPAANGQLLLRGVPRGMEKRVASLSLTVTPQGTITAMRMEEVDGSITAFSFAGEQANAPAPDAAFRFTAPAGVTITDALAPI